MSQTSIQYVPPDATHAYHRFYVIGPASAEALGWFLDELEGDTINSDLGAGYHAFVQISVPLSETEKIRQMIYLKLFCPDISPLLHFTADHVRGLASPDR